MTHLTLTLTSHCFKFNLVNVETSKSLKTILNSIPFPYTVIHWRIYICADSLASQTLLTNWSVVLHLRSPLKAASLPSLHSFTESSVIILIQPLHSQPDIAPSVSVYSSEAHQSEVLSQPMPVAKLQQFVMLLGDEKGPRSWFYMH